MTALGMILAILGLIGILVYGIILIVKAFQASIIWGLVYLFVPFGGFIFIITNWKEAGKPFLMQVLSVLVCYGGIIMMGTKLSTLQ